MNIIKLYKNIRNAEDFRDEVYNMLYDHQGRKISENILHCKLVMPDVQYSEVSDGYVNDLKNSYKEVDCYIHMYCNNHYVVMSNEQFTNSGSSTQYYSHMSREIHDMGYVYSNAYTLEDFEDEGYLILNKCETYNPYYHPLKVVDF